MKTLRSVLTCSLLTLCLLATSLVRADQNCAARFQSVRNDLSALKAFLRGMPKGAELHTHLSGIPTPEEVLALAVKSKAYDYFVQVPRSSTEPADPQAFLIVAVRKGAAAPQDDRFYFVPVERLHRPESGEDRALLERFRRAHLIAEDEPKPLEVFYKAIFVRRGAVVANAELVPQLAVDAVRQAHDQRLSYIELQLIPFPAYPDDSEEARDLKTNLTTARENLRVIRRAVDDYNATLPADERVEVRFTLSFSRTTPKTFTYLPMAFELASGNDDVARSISGVNLVGNEYQNEPAKGSHITGPEHYAAFLNTLRRLYPNVRLTIHAGEMTSRDWHIRDSVLMGAERIGHATNLYLGAPEDLLMLKRRGVLVEACLTSNRLLLGLPIEQHPFLDYLRSGLSVSLNSDDAGIFSTNMTEEFAKAAHYRKDLTWEELKALARNSLLHAFVDDAEKRRLLERFDKEMSEFESTLSTAQGSFR